MTMRLAFLRITSLEAPPLLTPIRAKLMELAVVIIAILAVVAVAVPASPAVCDGCDSCDCR